MTDPIRDAIQTYLDGLGDGYTVSHFVIPMGIERVIDGEIESAVWLYVPLNQPDYVADGLLCRAEEIQHAPVDDD